MPIIIFSVSSFIFVIRDAPNTEPITPAIAKGTTYLRCILFLSENLVMLPMPTPSNENLDVAIAVCTGMPKKIIVGGRISIAVPISEPITEDIKLTASSKAKPSISINPDVSRKFINLIQNIFSMVGNIPNFTKMDILRCFLRFKKNIGRQELAKELELGEGTARTILKILKSKKLLDQTKKGHFLSKKGEEILQHICSHISIPKSITMHDLYPDSKKIGMQIKNAPRLTQLYKLRDIAVKNGAEGAIILRFDGKLYAPGMEHERSYKELEKYFDFKNNDALIIAFSDKKKPAENGALAIAIELSSTLKMFISEF